MIEFGYFFYQKVRQVTLSKVLYDVLGDSNYPLPFIFVNDFIEV